MKKLALVLISLSFYTSDTACTVFRIGTGENVFVCKNFDYERIGAHLIYNPAGNRQYQDNERLSWHAQYCSMTINLQSPGKPLAGMNERGLVVEELSTVPFGIAKNPAKICLDEFQWVQYQLDNYASVAEVINDIDRLALVPEKYYLHYYIADNSGDAAIIQYRNGSALVFRGEDMPYPVLSNNPYQESLRYLNCFEGFGGNHHIPNSVSSNDRFVRITAQLRGIDQSFVQTEDAFAMLNTVRQHDTQWQVVYDPKRLLIHLRIGEDPMVHAIQLESFLVNSGAGFLVSNLYDPINGWEAHSISPDKAD